MGKEETRKPVIIFQTQAMPQAIRDIQEQFLKDPGILVLEARNSRECLSRLREAGRATFLFSIQTKEDLSEVLFALVRMHEQIRSGKVRALGCNALAHKKVEPSLRQKGCSEILSPLIGSRALLHKLSRLMTIVEANYRRELDFDDQFWRLKQTSSAGTIGEGGPVPGSSSGPWKDDLLPDELPADWKIDTDTIGLEVKVQDLRGQEYPARFLDLMDRQMVLEIFESEVPEQAECCFLIVRTERSQPKLSFRFSSRVDSVDEAVNQARGGRLFSFDLLDASDEDLRKFTEVFCSRQDSIARFLKTVKGV